VETELTDREKSVNMVFANRSEETDIFPLTVKEIAASQQKDVTLEKLAQKFIYKVELVENVEVLCKDGKLGIPKDLQSHAVAWYHHYLQHPGSTHL
jgi:hypothetical protein